MLSFIIYKMITGEEDTPHAFTLLEPSDKDIYEGSRVVKCTYDEEAKARL